MSESIVDVINRRFISGNSVSVERVHINLNEWNALRQQLEQAEQSCRARIKADRLYCMKHGDEFAREMAERLERAEARCAELETFCADKIGRLPLPGDRTEFADGRYSAFSEVYNEAQRLRTQADELENNQ